MEPLSLRLEHDHEHEHERTTKHSGQQAPTASSLGLEHEHEHEHQRTSRQSKTSTQTGQQAATASPLGLEHGHEHEREHERTSRRWREGSGCGGNNADHIKNNGCKYAANSAWRRTWAWCKTYWPTIQTVIGEPIPIRMWQAA